MIMFQILNYMFINIVYSLNILILMLICVAFLTLFERKVLGYIQLRKGPNKVGFLGILQPFSDVIKLLTKEFFFLSKLNLFLYNFCPVLILILILMLWNLFIFKVNWYSMNFGILYMLSLFSMGVYPIMMGGWSSNSNYSMLGCLRSVAQSVSFEVNLFLIMFMLILMIESYSFFMLLVYNIPFILMMFPVYLLFLISLLIEMNRTPFDLVEGESELVSGFNTEYFSGWFALIFMAEYLSIIFMSYLLTLMFFLIDYFFWFNLIWLYHIFFIIWIRGVLPRIRYDQLMFMCWKSFMSIILLYLIFMFNLKLFMILM